MSIESHITIRATFLKDDAAKIATSQLRRMLKKNQHELANALNELNPVENKNDYKDETVNVEDISRKKNILSIYSYTYTSEEPVWFSKSLSELGASKIHIRGQADGHVRNYYFLNGEKVSKNIFDGDKPKKPLSAKDVEINRDLFLPEGRVLVKAKLLSYWSIGDIYESIMMKYETNDGVIFYHKATGKLKEMAYNGGPRMCEFSASFERGKLEEEYVSFAKRPSKILIDKAGSFEEIRLDNLNGMWKVISNDGIESKNNDYWCFYQGEFTYVFQGCKIGPKKFRIHKNYLEFNEDSIKLISFTKNKMVAEWKCNYELERTDETV